MRNLSRLFVLLMLPLLLASAGLDGYSLNSRMNKTPEEKSERVAVGMWGGRHLRLSVTESGATLDFDCAHGEITQPLVLDRAGRFNVKGTYTRESHGPLRQGVDPPRTDARYTGSVSGGNMTLTVLLANSKDKESTYTLAHGKQGKIWKCM